VACIESTNQRIVRRGGFDRPPACDVVSAPDDWCYRNVTAAERHRFADALGGLALVPGAQTGTFFPNAAQMKPEYA
jgi:hypothetical protein